MDLGIVSILASGALVDVPLLRNPHTRHPRRSVMTLRKGNRGTGAGVDRAMAREAREGAARTALYAKWGR